MYTYISRTLTEKICAESYARVVKFLETTFCNNAWALQCTIAGISLALMGENVDRAFWTIGGGGVGQSLFTTLINNSISPKSGFFDFSALYMDGDVRKFLEQLVGPRAWTAQEATEGGAEKRILRQDIYKKIGSADPISRRPPYAKSTKTMSIRGMVRFEINKPLVPPTPRRRQGVSYIEGLWSS